MISCMDCHPVSRTGRVGLGLAVRLILWRRRNRHPLARTSLAVILILPRCLDITPYRFRLAGIKLSLGRFWESPMGKRRILAPMPIVSKLAITTANKEGEWQLVCLPRSIWLRKKRRQVLALTSSPLRRWKEREAIFYPGIIITTHPNI